MPSELAAIAASLMPSKPRSSTLAPTPTLVVHAWQHQREWSSLVRYLMRFVLLLLCVSAPLSASAVGLPPPGTQLLLAGLPRLDSAVPLAEVGLYLAGAFGLEVGLYLPKPFGDDGRLEAYLKEIDRRRKALHNQRGSLKVHQLTLPGHVYGADPLQAEVLPDIRGIRVFRMLKMYHSWFLALQEYIFHAVDAAMTASKPSFAIVDRFAFGAVHACHKHGVEYAIQNSGLLMDIDGPPSHVPAPFLGSDPRTSGVFQRSLYILFRLVSRVLDADLLVEINRFRTDNGLAKLRSPADVYLHKLVVTHSVFGFEYSRPVSRLIRMAGAFLPPASSKPLPRTLQNWLARSGARDVVLVRYDSFGFSACRGAHASRRVAYGFQSLGLRILWMGEECYSNDESLSIASMKMGEMTNLLNNDAIALVVSRATLIDVQMTLAAAQPCLLVAVTPYDREVAAHAEHTESSVTVFLSDMVYEEKESKGSEPQNATKNTCSAERRICELRQLERNSTTSPYGTITSRTWRALDQMVDDLPKMRRAAVRAAPLMRERNATQTASFSYVEVMSLGVHDMIPVGDLHQWYSRYLLDVYAVYGGVLVGLAVLLRVLWRLFWTLGTWLINTLDELTKPPAPSAEDHDETDAPVKS